MSLASLSLAHIESPSQSTTDTELAKPIVPDVSETKVTKKVTRKTVHKKDTPVHTTTETKLSMPIKKSEVITTPLHVPNII